MNLIFKKKLIRISRFVEWIDIDEPTKFKLLELLSTYRGTRHRNETSCKPSRNTVWHSSFLASGVIIPETCIYHNARPASLASLVLDINILSLSRMNANGCQLVSSQIHGQPAWCRDWRILHTQSNNGVMQNGLCRARKIRRMAECPA